MNSITQKRSADRLKPEAVVAAYVLWEPVGFVEDGIKLESFYRGPEGQKYVATLTGDNMRAWIKLQERRCKRQ